jgi:hypothetical protein
MGKGVYLCECCGNTMNEYNWDKPARRPTPYERTRAAVYATGNKWAIENFHATHD